MMELIGEHSEERLLLQIHNLKQSAEPYSTLFVKKQAFKNDLSMGEFFLDLDQNHSNASIYIYSLDTNELCILWQIDAFSEAYLKSLLENKYLKDVENHSIYIFDLSTQFEMLEQHLRPEYKIEREPEVEEKTQGSQLIYTDNQVEKYKTLKSSQAYKEAKQSILLVDDQSLIRVLLSQMLGTMFECYTASHAQEALELFLQHAPSLCLIDIKMPGIDGHELIHTLKNIDEHAQIVVMTGSQKAEDIKQAKDNNVCGFIQKQQF